MSLSVFDLFTIGIGPSSSHTVGPMRAARRFVDALERDEELPRTGRVLSEMFGSLGATGRGHGTHKAVLLGLEGETPEDVDPAIIDPRVEALEQGHALRLLGRHPVPFDREKDLLFHRRKSLPLHPNGMRFTAYAADGTVLDQRIYYSVGGGFVVDERTAGADELVADHTPLPYPYRSGADLLEMGARDERKIWQLQLDNERAWRSDEVVTEGLLQIWSAMESCVERGCRLEGTLPGGFRVPRRAPTLHRELTARGIPPLDDPLALLDWVDLFAIAVNEENAAGGRVVTAPTNGAAGIVPAVLLYTRRFVPNTSDHDVVRFLLTAGAIGILFKQNASISGAEVGCQGEVGVACSMAAAGLAEVLGGTNAQIENAAEIGMEHNLGLTCDPVGGLVQIPCIERNAMGAVKAINAARLALRGDGSHKVSLDRVIKTMRETGADMQSKYKETSRGGLAINVIEC